MKTRNIDFLKEIGFVPSEVEEFEKKLTVEMMEFLSENRQNITKNLLYLEDFFPKDILIGFLRKFSKSFAMNPKVFSEYIEMLKKEGTAKWTTVLLQQYMGYDGYDEIFMRDGEWDRGRYEPFLEVLASNDPEEIEFSIYTSLNPCEKEFKWIQMLKLLHIYIGTESVKEEYLYELEISKEIVFRNIREQLYQGVSTETVYRLMKKNPMIFVNRSEWIGLKLRNDFGEDNDLLNGT